MNLSYLVDRLQTLGLWLRNRVLYPMLRAAARAMLNITEQPKQDPPSETEWKQKALADFSSWLSELPENDPADGPMEMDACDLYTLLAEFAALRQEIKLQTREQHKTLKTQESLIENHRRIVTLFQERMDGLDRLEATIRRNTENKTVLPFLEIRDALVRGWTAAGDVSASRGFFKPAPKGLQGVVEGYELALRRFDRALAAVGIRPVLAEGKPFDPACMRAVDRRKAPEKEPGIVLEEYICGFVRGDEVIRPAEVVVNER